MSQSVSRKRPWLAALLSLLVTGLGHVYLRRWKRALGWLAVLFATSILFVDPAALEALAGGRPVDLLEIAPILSLSLLCVTDAYLVARTQNQAARAPADTDSDLARCPACGREVDADLEFCHWCSTELDTANDTR